VRAPSLHHLQISVFHKISISRTSNPSWWLQVRTEQQLQFQQSDQGSRSVFFLPQLQHLQGTSLVSCALSLVEVIAQVKLVA
jgi:hypothetical protein